MARNVDLTQPARMWITNRSLIVEAAYNTRINPASLLQQS